MNTTLKSSSFTAALLAVVMAPFGLSAYAHPIVRNFADAKPPASQFVNQLPVENVAGRVDGYRGRPRPPFHGDGGRHYRYHPGRHGPRYGHRYGKYNHFYGGYWYAFPWWLGAATAAAPYYTAPYFYDAEPDYADDDHVEWCLSRYRSYNPRTDTFRGYDGFDYRCVSPYSY